MSDLNDLAKPVTTDTEPNVLDTLRGHIVRAITWAGYSATANKVAGMMSAVTAAVSGGRSLRLYRRNDANSADEEVVTLPGISVGGNAATASAAQSGSALETALSAKAPLNSPGLTGTPTAPNVVAGTNNTQIANTAFVQTAVANLVGSTPAALDTLAEFATALGNDANFSTTITNALANKAPSSHVGSNGGSHAAATPTVNGFMSSTDKSKLDGVAAGAQVNSVTSVANRTGAVVLTVADVAGVVSINNNENITSRKYFTLPPTLEGVSTGKGGGGAAYSARYGELALENNTTGNRNIAMGYQSMYQNTEGSDNTALGHSALFGNTAGFQNTAVGGGALSGNVTYNNISGLGYYAQATGNNQVQLGGTAVTTYVWGTVQNRSDARDKADIQDTVLGLDFVNALRPVDYKLDMRDDYKPERPVDFDLADPGEFATETEIAAFELAKAEHQAAMNAWIVASKHENLVRDGTKKRKRFHHGLIAQEVKALIDATGVDFGGYQDHKIAGGEDVLSIGYDELIAPLIKAVQQLSARLVLLEGKNND